jgi:hypothetical protein
MRKSFDTVEHNLLWYKLQRIGVHGKFLTAIQSLYNEVKCTVRINNDLTPWFNVEAGVKQGLSYTNQILHLAYVEDCFRREQLTLCHQHKEVD